MIPLEKLVKITLKGILETSPVEILKFLKIKIVFKI